MPISDHFKLLGLDVYSNPNCGRYYECLAKTAVKKLGILFKVRSLHT